MEVGLFFPICDFVRFLLTRPLCSFFSTSVSSLGNSFFIRGEFLGEVTSCLSELDFNIISSFEAVIGFSFLELVFALELVMELVELVLVAVSAVEDDLEMGL